MIFDTNYDAVKEQIQAIDPIAYGRTRNYLDGAVTKLSPYISRGVISTKQILNSVMNRGYVMEEVESFVKELAWRDYFQRTLQSTPTLITTAIKNKQHKVNNSEIPMAILAANTGIEAIDKGITSLYKSGYMHNHLRMYVASIVCNVAQSDWKLPSQWLYFHLLDADVASNICSWQWVCGANSNKKYFANQENINRYCATAQQSTFLDLPYEDFENLEIPAILCATAVPEFNTVLPLMANFEIDNTRPTLIYNFYNLDPDWHTKLDCNRVLILEPSHFSRFPVSSITINFVLELSKNIPSVQIFVGEFAALKAEYQISNFIFKEHPLFTHYEGVMEVRDWIFPNVKGNFLSFFSYWKKAMKNFK